MNFKDRIIRATGQKTPFRLIVVDLTATMNEIGKQHNAQGFALKLLAENSIASIFLSASLKYAGTVSLTTRFGGEITKVSSDTTPMGLVRAMIPQAELQAVGGNEPALIPQSVQVVKVSASFVCSSMPQQGHLKCTIAKPLLEGEMRNEK